MVCRICRHSTPMYHVCIPLEDYSINAGTADYTVKTGLWCNICEAYCEVFRSSIKDNIYTGR